MADAQKLFPDCTAQPVETYSFFVHKYNGITVGMTSCLLIFMYVKFGLSYDSMHSKADRIYSVVSDIKTPSDVIRTVVPHNKKIAGESGVTVIVLRSRH